MYTIYKTYKSRKRKISINYNLPYEIIPLTLVHMFLVSFPSETTVYLRKMGLYYKCCIMYFSLNTAVILNH